MKVLLVGTGGREHALGVKLAQSPSVTHLYVQSAYTRSRSRRGSGVRVLTRLSSLRGSHATPGNWTAGRFHDKVSLSSATGTIESLVTAAKENEVRRPAHRPITSAPLRS